MHGLNPLICLFILLLYKGIQILPMTIELKEVYIFKNINEQNRETAML